MEKRLLTSKEVAGIARVHPVTVRRWILTGKLSSIRIGGVRRIPVAALIDFLEESSRGRNPNPGKGDAA
jgi:excisionase family DNA binding protein